MNDPLTGWIELFFGAELTAIDPCITLGVLGVVLDNN
ncbi:hypothetical protein J2X66_000451 [Pseudomonas sp. 3296]|nr:hypothetical protein [Pseudomonas sp. 3296]